MSSVRRESLSSRPGVAVVLAAGKGTRMRSSVPKVLHRAAGRPLIQWVLDSAREAGCERLLVVVGHGAEEVRRSFDASDVTWVVQEEQLGTGHALAQVEEHLRDASRLLVLSGDVPGVSAETLTALQASAAKGWGAMAVAELEEPGNLGRVVARDDGALERIVEATDASAGELRIKTVNAGIYVLPAPEIFDFLKQLEPSNVKAELYLTVALTAAVNAGRSIRLLELADPGEALGVNNRGDLAQVHRFLLRRKSRALLDQGVTILDPERTVIEAPVRVGRDTEIHPGVTLSGDSTVGEGCTIRSGSWVRDSEIGPEAVVGPYSVIEGARVGTGSVVGPFARLRPGTVLGAGTRVGNFVEVKNAQLGDAVKAGHLAYLGDVEIGEGTNIGAGTVTCNFDGEEKHRTEIGRGAFIGSDTMLVAPVKVGDNATTGAGSVITGDVPENALGIARVRQRNVRGWSKTKKHRKG